MNTSFNQLHLVNTYGAFGSVGKDRYEIIIEGTNDDPTSPGAKWQPYEFHAKPGDPTRRPAMIAPYHHRIDWQIWFAAMSRIERQPWLVHFIYKLLHGDPHVVGLLRTNPFPHDPPLYIRADLYRYEFTRFKDGSTDWWRRERIAPYLSPVSRDDASLNQAVEGYGFRRY